MLELKPRQDQQTRDLVRSQWPLASSSFSHLYDFTKASHAATPDILSQSLVPELWDGMRFEPEAYASEPQSKEDKQTGLLALSQWSPVGAIFPDVYDATNANPAATSQGDGRSDSPFIDSDLLRHNWNLDSGYSPYLPPKPTPLKIDDSDNPSPLSEIKSSTFALKYWNSPPHNSSSPEPELVGSHCAPVREPSAWRLNYKIGTGACGTVFLENVHLPGMKSPE